MVQDVEERSARRSRQPQRNSDGGAEGGDAGSLASERDRPKGEAEQAQLTGRAAVVPRVRLDLARDFLDDRQNQLVVCGGGDRLTGLLSGGQA